MVDPAPLECGDAAREARLTIGDDVVHSAPFDALSGAHAFVLQPGTPTVAIGQVAGGAMGQVVETIGIRDVRLDCAAAFED